MARIPDRFLGFSFSVGDILIEIDNKFAVKYADGAINDIGLTAKEFSQIKFTDLLSADDKHAFEHVCSSLKAANRVGPIYYWLNGRKKKKNMRPL